MLKQALACVQPHQSLHCSHTCAKWAYIRHILSVNAQTSLSVCAVLPEPLLLSHMHKMGVNMEYFCQSMLRRDLVCMQSSQSVHCSRTCAKWAYIRHIPSVNAQTSLSVCAVFQEPLLLSHMYKMGVYMAFLKSMLRRDLVCLQSCHWAPSLLSHIHKMSGLWHLLSANAQTSLSMRAVSPEPTLLSRMRKMSVHTAYSFSKCSDEP